MNLVLCKIVFSMKETAVLKIALMPRSHRQLKRLLSVCLILQISTISLIIQFILIIIYLEPCALIVRQEDL